LLILAGIDRLDKKMTVGQMQGELRMSCNSENINAPKLIRLIAKSLSTIFREIPDDGSTTRRTRSPRG
jgi:hypothetical protein